MSPSTRSSRKGSLHSNRSKSRRNIIILIGIFIVVIATPIILTSLRTLVTTAGGGAESYSLTGPYRSLHSLKGNSTIIVLASVDGLATTFYGRTSTGAQVGPFYVFRVNVISYIKGSGPQTIYFSAGLNRPDVPTPSPGQLYFLFLQAVSSAQCAPSPPAPPCILPPTPLESTYTSTGGPQGRFLVENDLVYGFKTLYPQGNDWMIVDAKGVPTNQFTAEVNNA